MSVAACLPHCGPIRRQLLGCSPTGGMGYTSPNVYDTPLAEWLLAVAGVGADGQGRALLQVPLRPPEPARL
jgi:hypothetical protein